MQLVPFTTAHPLILQVYGWDPLPQASPCACLPHYFSPLLLPILVTRRPAPPPTPFSFFFFFSPSPTFVSPVAQRLPGFRTSVAHQQRHIISPVPLSRHDRQPLVTRRRQTVFDQLSLHISFLFSNISPPTLPIVFN